MTLKTSTANSYVTFNLPISYTSVITYTTGIMGTDNVPSNVQVAYVKTSTTSSMKVCKNGTFWVYLIGIGY